LLLVELSAEARAASGAALGVMFTLRGIDAEVSIYVCVKTKLGRLAGKKCGIPAAIDLAGSKPYKPTNQTI
jgi:hypothetical protein